MFPPQKKPAPAGPGRGPAGPPDPFGPGPGGPPDPMGGGPSPFGPPPGMPKPGQGMDPMMAMMHGIAGPPPPQPMGPPMGPNGMPIGGTLPMGDNDGDEDMGGSDLLKALAGSVGAPPGDPYGVSPMQPGMGFEGMGTGDPNMGLQQLLQILALGRNGVGGGPGPGASGAPMDPLASMGIMAGM